MKLEVKGLKILKTNPNFQHLNKPYGISVHEDLMVID